MEQFEQFCNEIIKTLIKPQVTVVSGNEIINENFFEELFRRFGT